MAQKDRSDKVSLNQQFGRLYAAQSAHFVLWLPVFMGAGIWAYFILEREPPLSWALAPLVPGVLLITGLARRAGWGVLAAAWLSFMAASGFALAMASAHRAEAPVVPYPLGETVEGRVMQISRSASGAPRLLLDSVTIYGVEPADTPERVRLTVLDAQGPLPRPGERLRVYATLMPPGEPVEPGGFDFQRRAFFERLGGVGLTRGEIIGLPDGAATSLMDRGRVWLAKLREAVSRQLRDTLPGPPGAFAAAIIVGDRVDIGDADAEALRASNLAHLLAISGLHMGILTGLIFTVARLLMSLPPGIALRWPTKKLAAIAALAAGFAYLLLSGSTVATQRAFVMVGVAFFAVLLDRPAITLRSLAFAAAIILAIRPISLLDAGFQMSFAATIALVAGFEALRNRPLSPPKAGHWLRAILVTIVVYFGGLVISSLLAGLATAPIAAYHFNRTAPYGLLANLLAVPLMGLWIAPWACLAGVLAPLGLSAVALVPMGWGIEGVLKIAHAVADLPGAVKPVPAAAPWILALIVMGGLWLVLWQGRARFSGALLMVFASLFWSQSSPRPELLIAPQARLIGVMSPEGRALDHATAQGFAARTWLRRDGDWSDQETAATRGRFDRAEGALSAELGHGWRVEAHWGKKVSRAALERACQPKTVLVARNGPPLRGPCEYLGKRELRSYGAVAATVSDQGIRMTHARPPGRQRLWTAR